MKIAFYMTGGFGKILKNCVDFLPDANVTAICPNWQSYQEVAGKDEFFSNDYIYDGLNETFDSVDVEDFCKTYSDINLSEIAFVDKAHFKKKSGDYHLRYLCAFGARLAEIFDATRPDYIFFPIIETNDAMLAYRMAQHFGIRPIVNAHSRFAGLSFYSESHKELLPRYLELIENKEDTDPEWANNFIASYRENPKSFDGLPKHDYSDLYDYATPSTAWERLKLNLRLKFGKEKHNLINSLWIKFQVHFERFFVPMRNAYFYIIEKLYLRPHQTLPESFDFFPIHFSPESSINVPAPYYIDQIRVVDKILLEQRNNRTLVVKEHPAMFGFRPFSFYKILKNSPLVMFVERQMPSYKIIQSANTVYSVTGTACLEAFLLGVNWVQYGDNFLSDWAKRRKQSGSEVTPEAFLNDVHRVSHDFILYSPGRSANLDRVLFSKENVQKISEHILFHIAQTENCNAQNYATSIKS